MRKELKRVTYDYNDSECKRFKGVPKQDILG